MVYGKDIGPTISGPLNHHKIASLRPFFDSNSQLILDPVILLTSEQLLSDGNHRLALSYLTNKPVWANIYEEGDLFPIQDGFMVVKPSMIERVRSFRRRIMEHGHISFQDLCRSSF